ncbi:hypothetical protein CBH50_004575 [Salmonella enterica subsp. diarizonae serovar 60:r:e,n,x,z15]|nr:hypothetical protein [Salmonella enterica subsp. diarizonae serovar 60:r:e,n,x,z15]
MPSCRPFSTQDSGDGRFYFDYARATGDLQAMKQGISQYLERTDAVGLGIISTMSTLFIIGFIDIHRK